MYKRGVVMFGVVSLTMGNSILPFTDSLPADAHLISQRFLRHSFFFSELLQFFVEFHLHHLCLHRTLFSRFQPPIDVCNLSTTGCINHFLRFLAHFSPFLPLYRKNERGEITFMPIRCFASSGAMHPSSQSSLCALLPVRGEIQRDRRQLRDH